MIATYSVLSDNIVTMLHCFLRLIVVISKIFCKLFTGTFERTAGTSGV